MTTSFLPSFVPALLAALGGSFHCAGMCGGFVLAASARREGLRLSGLLGRQALYHSGKTSSYLFLGALAGIGSERLATLSVWWVRGASLAAAGLLLLLGLRALGWIPAATVRARPTGPVTQLWVRATRRVASLKTGLSPLYLGAFSGLLPCPLVYAFLAAGAATGSVPQALTIMGALGLGTVPLLLVVAWTGSTLSPLLRARFLQASGILLISLAIFTVYRGWAELPCCGTLE